LSHEGDGGYSTKPNANESSVIAAKLFIVEKTVKVQLGSDELTLFGIRAAIRRCDTAAANKRGEGILLKIRIH
jgi:hypothetical protein